MKTRDAMTPPISPSASPNARVAYSITDSGEDTLYLRVLGTFKEEGTDLKAFERMYFSNLIKSMQSNAIFLKFEFNTF